jgi:HrpA-like RNA helicase
MIKKGFPIKLIIASATLGDMNFTNFTSKTIQSVGRMFPIKIHWNEDNIDPTDMKKAVIFTINKIMDVITDGNNKGNKEGILVFVPGEAEVETIATQLESMKGLNLVVFRLYSNIPPEEQMEAFVKVSDDVIKVVISTNVGESSITIPDVCKVIDMGLQKTPYDNRIGIRLVTDFAPKDKLTQRKGRAGRTTNGDYYPMFTENKWKTFKDSDLSDMDRILPYMIVLEFLDAGLDAQEILEIDDTRYKPLIEKLVRLKLIDENNKITNIGHAVPNYPFSLENAIVAYRAMNLIYKGSDKNQLDRDDPAVVAILICIAMIEGSQGNSFFWIPKEHRKTSATKQVYMNEKYKNIKGDTDFSTFINIFSSMIHEGSGTSGYAYVKWAQDNSMNNKLMSNVRKHFKRLIEMTYGISGNEIEGSVEKQTFNMLKSFYGISNLSQLTDQTIMSTVYGLFEDVYSDCIFDEPVEIGKKKLLHYHSKDGTKYRIDGFRSFSRMEELKMHRLVSLQVIETKNGLQSSRYISCLFPSKDQATREETGELEVISKNSEFSMEDIDFSMLGDIEDFTDLED